MYLQNILIGIAYGVRDSLFGIGAIRYVQSYNEERQRGSERRKSINILQRYFQCCALNGGLFGVIYSNKSLWLDFKSISLQASILIFDHLVLSWLYLLMQFLFGSQHGTVSTVWVYLKPTLSYFFSAFWVLPLFLLSRFVNALWFQVLELFLLRTWNNLFSLGHRWYCIQRTSTNH